MFSHTTHTIIHATVLTLENNKKKSGIVLKEITEFHILWNLPVPPKLSISLNLTSRQKSSHSILPEILKENRSEKKSDTSQNAQ